MIARPTADEVKAATSLGFCGFSRRLVSALLIGLESIRRLARRRGDGFEKRQTK